MKNAINLNRSMGFALRDDPSCWITLRRCAIAMEARDVRVGARETALPFALGAAWPVVVPCGLDCLEDEDDGVLAFRGRVDPA